MAKTVAIFSPNGVQNIQNGKEDEFFAGANADVKEGLITMNALGIVALAAIERFGGVLVPPSPDYKTQTTEALEEGIKRAGGNVSKAKKAAVKVFNEMNQDGQVALLMPFVG